VETRCPKCFGTYQGTPENLDDFVACNGGQNGDALPCRVRAECSVLTAMGSVAVKRFIGDIGFEPPLDVAKEWIEQEARRIGWETLPVLHQYRPDIVLRTCDPVVLSLHYRQQRKLSQEKYRLDTKARKHEMERRRTQLNRFVISLFNVLATMANKPIEWRPCNHGKRIRHTRSHFIAQHVKRNRWAMMLAPRNVFLVVDILPARNSVCVGARLSQSVLRQASSELLLAMAEQGQNPERSEFVAIRTTKADIALQLGCLAIETLNENVH
jgi:hypothetical protein